MVIIESIDDVKKTIHQARVDGNSIGFVPTMGSFHSGHLSLIQRSVSECDVTVVSIFVNPLQFNNLLDYNVYPRDVDRDIQQLEKERVDILFIPRTDDMYKEQAKTYVEVEGLSDVLEGKFRPGHFKGVSTVVCKLLNIVQPENVYFGWKDAQQLVIIKKMVRDLNMPVNIIGCPTVRERDGLAASSRNIFIGDKRIEALSLYRALKRIEEMVLKEKVRDISVLLTEGGNVIKEYPLVELQYLEIFDAEEFVPAQEVKGSVIALGAIQLPSVRLIDNIAIKVL